MAKPTTKPTVRQALDECVDVLLDVVYAGFTNETWQAWIAKRDAAILMGHEAVHGATEAQS